MEFSDIPSVFDLVHLAAAKGIRHAVISPGSRNAPLSISLHRHPDIQTFVIPDERVAAFFALGLTQQSGQPAMLCCTSGSAVLNYAPAIAEAYYQRVPLFVVTADRPAELIDQGDGQTIRQKDVFRNYIRHSDTLIQGATSESDRGQNRERIERAIDATTDPVGGPVHLNFPFHEPLYNTRKYADEEVPVSAPAPQEKPLKAEVNDEMRTELSGAQNILVLCAMLNPSQALANVLERWGQKEQVAIMTETTSNLNGPAFFPSIDRLIFTFDEEDLDRFRPDLLITLGNQIISKRIKAILRERKPKHHWHIDPDRPHPNTFQALSRSIIAEPAAFMEALLPHLPNQSSDYRETLRVWDRTIDGAHAAFMQSCPFTDLKAVDTLLHALPSDYNLQLGNSASVRYVQLFKHGRARKCNCNRGTSGIDGCTSTALGAATLTGEPTLLLTGDMAFLYDSNAFWHPHVPSNLKIVVMNNGGGGIFRIIDGPQDAVETEKYFEAHHSMTAERVAKMYDLPYFAARDNSELEVQLRALFSENSDKPAILEVFTPRLDNADVLKDYFKQLSAARKTVKTVGHE